MIKLKISSFFLMSIILMGCKSQNQNNSTTEITPETSENMLQSQNNFSFELFKQALKTDTDQKNLLLSPQSIYMDFAMLYNAAEGETKKAMQNAFYLGNNSAKILNQSQFELLKILPKSDTSVVISMANAIWHTKDLTPKKSFLEVNKKFYHAKIEAADFKNSQTISDINQWVNSNTNGKIPTIIDNIAPGEVLFLLNAVYFKGNWKDDFDANQTQDLVFYTNSEEKKVPFMFKDKRMNYFKNESLQLVELPYGNGNFSMMVLLPTKEKSVEELVEKLNFITFSEWISEMNSTSLKLYLPKWESSYEAHHLKENLTAMGMGIAFENNADFSGLFDKESTKISQIKHKTYIKTDEEGTEAAGATSIGMATTSMPMPSQEEMKADRPFVYLIVEKTSNTVLFIGIVNDPSEK